MDRCNIEARRRIWAGAEISWEDPTGTPYHAPATMKDTSASGACLQVGAPIGIGSRLTVKWHKEQFGATARNCRRDGQEFLLGVGREKDEAERKNQTRRTSNGAETRPTRDLIDEIQNAARQAASPAKSPARALPDPRLTPLSSVRASAPDVPGGARDKARNNSAPAATPGRPSHSAARLLVKKGKLCNPKSFSRISGVASKTKARPPNPHPRRPL
jgi:hypothetical protein